MGKLWTYTYTNNTKAQIDYVFINKKWKNSTINCEAYPSFEGVSSIPLEGVQAKNIQATILFVDFTKAFDSIHRGKIEQILPAYSIPKETVAAIMILYRNTKVKVRSPDGDTDYFDIVAGVLQGDTIAPYLFIICLDYVLRTSIDKIKENGFELTKKRSRRYPAKTITNADYANDIAILANAPAQAKSLLHSLE